MQMRRRTTMFLAALALLGAAACDRSPTAPEELLVNEIILAVDDGSYAFSHTDHWHGAPAVRAGADIGMTLFFTSIRMPPPRVDIKFDRSFVFALQDIESGAVLFVGAVNKPNDDMQPQAAQENKGKAPKTRR